MKTITFVPAWASPPGRTIENLLVNSDFSNADLARSLHLSEKSLSKLICGEKEITEDIASGLAECLGGTKIFWLNREVQYQEDMDRLNISSDEIRMWLGKLPLNDMIKFGWLSVKDNSLEGKMRACLSYFGVNSINQWYREYSSLLGATAFRMSESFDSTSEAVICWLREGMVQSQKYTCEPWDKKGFLNSLYDIKKLSRISNPQEFLPRIQNIFGKYGVFLSIARTPRRCHASGACISISESKKMILLSFRHLTDDHFWFSLFHEAGHLILHEDEELFVDGAGVANTDKESEANLFAQNILIPKEYWDDLALLRPRDWKKILRIAKKLEISPGIVVGQMQKKGILDYKYLNKIKVKYKWMD